MAEKTNSTPPKKVSATARQTAEYRQTEETPARPDVGTQPQFKKRAAPKTYRYDSSLAYAHNGDTHEYVPDFMVRLVGQGERRLIVEVKGFDELEEVKRAAAQRWVDAVNAEGSFGRWGYVVAKVVSRVRDLISAAAA